MNPSMKSRIERSQLFLVRAFTRNLTDDTRNRLVVPIRPERIRAIHEELRSFPERSPFWLNFKTISIIGTLKEITNDPIGSLILSRAGQHLLPGGIGGRIVVESYFPEERSL